MVEGQVLTIAEVARELRCSKAHVNKLVNGKVAGISPLPSLRIGRRRIVRRQSLRDWMQSLEIDEAYSLLRSSLEVDYAD